MPLTKAFTEHPQTVGETYSQHFMHASSFGLRMVAGGIACLLHGIFPFLFVKTGSDQIRTLHGRMVVNRDKLTPGKMPAPLDFVI